MILSVLIHRTLVALLVVLCAARGNARADASSEKEAVFADWYDRLPLIDAQNLQPIRIWIGVNMTDADGNSTPASWLGFLKQDDGPQFQAVTAFDSEQSYVKKGNSPGDQRFVGYRKVVLGDEIRRLLAELTSADEGRFWERNVGLLSFGGLDREAQLFLLTRWCVRHGDADLTDSVRPVLSSFTMGPGADSVEDRLHEEFTAHLRWRAFCAFGEKDKTRPELLAKFRQIVELCPKADLGREKAAIAILERMIREDGEHTPLSAEQLEALPPADQAKEWVFRLRDERGEKPFATGIVAGEEWPSNGAALALAKLGFAALPALEAALDDHSFSREPPFPWTRDEVLRVRDFALKVLCKLSGCEFDPPNVRGRSVDEEREARFQGARAWARGVREKGEKNYLIDEVRSGGPLAVKFAERLLDLAPDEAIPVVIESAKSRTSPEDRQNLALLLWTHKDPRCIDFFVGLLHSAEVSDRAIAAYALRGLEDARAIPVMIAEWQRIRVECSRSGWPAFQCGSGYNQTKILTFNYPSVVANYLAMAPDVEATLAIGENATDLPVEWRAGIIALYFPNRSPDARKALKAIPVATQKAVEDILTGFLNDREPVPQSFTNVFWQHDALILSARICDLAALTLHELWPEKYAFDRWLPPAARLTQCTEGANIRLKELGEPLLPLPERVAPVEPDLGKVGEIVSVRSDPATTDPPADVVAKLSALQGAALSSDAIVSAVSAYAAKPMPNTHRLALYISRFSDLSGISILAEFIPGSEEESAVRGDRQLNVWTDCEKSSRNLPRGTAYGHFADFADPAKWRPLRRAIDSAVAAPDTAFAIVVWYNY